MPISASELADPCVLVNFLAQACHNIAFGRRARLVSTLSQCRLQPAYDVLHLGGEINVMMHHLPAPCFSAIDIRDATLELPPLTGEG